MALFAGMEPVEHLVGCERDASAGIVLLSDIAVTRERVDVLVDRGETCKAGFFPDFRERRGIAVAPDQFLDRFVDSVLSRCHGILSGAGLSMSATGGTENTQPSDCADNRSAPRSRPGCDRSACIPM